MHISSFEVRSKHVCSPSVMKDVFTLWLQRLHKHFSQWLVDADLDICQLIASVNCYMIGGKHWGCSWLPFLSMPTSSWGLMMMWTGLSPASSCCWVSVDILPSLSLTSSSAEAPMGRRRSAIFDPISELSLFNLSLVLQSELTLSVVPWKWHIDIPCKHSYYHKHFVSMMKWTVLLPGLLLVCLSVLIEMSDVFFTTGLVLCRTLLKFPSRIHSCCNPSSGVMRLAGSHLKSRGTQLRHVPVQLVCRTNVKVTYVRQHLTKSKNKASLVFRAADSSLELSRLFFPLLFIMFLGFPLESAHSAILFVFFVTLSTWHF